MRVPVDWLKEYVDFELSSRELAEKLTQAGIEVEGISQLDSGLDGVLVGEIIAFERHPASEKLWVVQVDAGKERVQVVAGIQNYQCGDKVPVALPGAKLAGGEITCRQVRGIDSQGMLCSAAELGLDLQVEYGILILDKDTPVGISIVTALNLDEDILELELTPNRADCLGLLGIAQELSALTGGKLKRPEVLPAGEKPLPAERVKIVIEDSNLCSRYTARITEKVVVRPAPLSFQLRLLKAGIRPINNVVDISNYVMWETGQPLHTFDFSCITGSEIIVRRASRGEAIVTLDNQERELAEDMLVIADCCKPVGIAGVMGGLNSEITAATETVLIESACFNPVSIRRTSRKLGLVSEASQRFEKGTDIGGTLFAVNRAAFLMKRLSGCNVLPGAADNYPVPYKKKIISLRPERARAVLGMDLPAAKMKEILNQLGMDTRGEAGCLYVDVPSRRRDINGEIDLIEEIGRIYGCDFLEATLPWGIMTQGQKTPAQKNINTIKRFLTARGFFEIITFSFLRKKALQDLLLKEEDPLLKAIPLENPLSEEQGILRTTILPNMLDTVKYNLNR
ncbi:MAG TPA: phenylalanine--tRNA ligase subunit beta, partial [Firmicutes bacterium]|nr:phenylalanine--tRNA ligase subunit beta [Bacillota bacterium]